MTKKAAIIGGGVIGGGWAARFLLNGWDVRVFDPDPEAERKIGEVMAGARRALPMLYDHALPEEGAMTFHGSIAEAVEGADWVQESVSERLDLKHKVMAEIQAANPGVPIGSSTSGYKPSQLQEGAADPGRIMVAHPFNPVYLLPLIEVVPSPATDEAAVEEAETILREVGLYPLRVRQEIDAHIADRFLEAVWREALWLVKDGVATTEEIDNAIRYGFGLRWAQMGLFETYRVAGGEAGMRHFMAQFGPALKWPWTKLMDVPEFDDELVELIAGQSDAQSGHMSIRELERQRDGNLVAMMRALKQQGTAAGALITEHQKTLRPTLEEAAPMRTVRRVVPVDWTDMNGHMNEGRYGQIFSDAAEAVMAHVGADDDYVAAGMSYFTVETTVKYLAETHAGEMVEVWTRVTEGEGKKLRCLHEMRRAADGEVLATCDQLMLHVSLETRRTCLPTDHVRENVERLAALHAGGA
ncbi:carnitine 3-dehydrogenase [Roseovarius sp. SCSIO 43702]|uniref:carnitine 3-dehydrogenase n=1 Tax=Roseovarius sp. SCSIO 43702 TaxID=2823043 RepID=UPI001C73BA59|nr:carnitine 3-dehydrogenase [Roseovarius sp. SCSIO 43702]QYX57875.1 carnitine 3-dehydrogenase [Roseovarius sp. SCSIO 43702]